MAGAAMPAGALRRPRLPALDAAQWRVRERFLHAAPAPVPPHGWLRWCRAATPPPLGLLCRSAGSALWWGLHPWSALEPLLGADLAELPPAARLLAFEAAALPLTRHLESLWGGPIDAVAVQALPAELCNELSTAAALSLGFELLPSASQPSARGLLVASTARLAAAAQQLQRASPGPCRKDLPLVVALVAARTALAWHELRTLELGAAIRLGPGSAARRRHVTLMVGDQALRLARMDGQQLTVEALVTKEADPTLVPTAVGSQDALDALDEVRCSVVFEVARLSMTVAEVAALREGSTLALQARLDDAPVSIVVNGQRIGRGELAEVGDELVVVVTALRS
jgi:type III secretion system YscQ/HrcQ family protein